MEFQLLAGLVGQRQDMGGPLGGATGLCHDILNIALAETVNVRARRSCGKVIVPWLRFPGRGSPNSASDKVFSQDTGPLFRVFPEDADRIASNQMLLNFGRTKSPGRSGHDIRDTLATVVGKTRRNASVESIFTCVAPASALYDTRVGSRNRRYVMRANSSTLTLRLEWQSSLATLPF